jgi:hypothetical protein
MHARSLSGNREICGLALHHRKVVKGPHREGEEPKPVVNDPQKSDGCTVAMKSANKPDGAGAESMERRRPTEGNAGESCTHRTLSREGVSLGLDRVRERAKSRKQERFTALLHHVDVERLRRAYFALKRADAYSAEDDRLFRRNVTGYSAESALAGFSTLAGHDRSRFRGLRWS